MTLSWIRRKIATQLFKLVDTFERLVERIDAPRCEDCGAVLADNERGATCEHCRRFASENLPRYEVAEPIRAGQLVSMGEDGKLRPASQVGVVQMTPTSIEFEFIIGNDGASPFIEHETEHENGRDVVVVRHRDDLFSRATCAHCAPVRDYP